MPKFELKPITRPVELGDYAPEYAGATFHIWVNMPRAQLNELFLLQREAADLVEAARLDPTDDLSKIDRRAALWKDIDARLNAWYARTWSQHADAATHWTADDVRELSDQLVSADPQAWYWLSRKCQATITEYRNLERKN